MTDSGEKRSFFFPWAALMWALVSIGVFIIGTQTISLKDVERFPNNLTFIQNETEAENTVELQVIDGLFEYNVVPEEVVPVQTGQYEMDSDSELVRVISNAVEEAESVRVTETEIFITHNAETESDDVIRRLRNPINGFLANERDAIEVEVYEAEENTVVFTTTDPRLEFAQFIPQLVDATETYENRNAAANGSTVSQAIVAADDNIETVTINPDSITFTYADGNEGRIIDRLTEGLNDYYPRSTLRPNFWVLTLGFDPSIIVNVTPLDTGVPLLIFTISMVIVELILGFYLRNSEEKLLRPLLRAATVFLLFWSLFGHEPIWDYTLSQIFPNSNQLIHPNTTVINFTAQHLELVLVSSLITIPSGLFIGILVTRENFRELLPLINNIVNSGQTVPTLAIVAVMAPLIGFGFWPAIIALIAYGLLPVVRNTIAGLEAVSRFIIDSAKGMGMTPGQILFQVELPIASRVIMAGVRTSMVVNIGTATLGAFVGSGGLGTPIASGLGMSIDAFVLLGALPAAILAILVDYILGRVEFVLTPKGLQI